jgi:uncharacterized protein (TIGR00251 family)
MIRAGCRHLARLFERARRPWPTAASIYDLHSLVLIRYSHNGRALTFPVIVAPRASRSEIVGEHDGALKVRIAAPPVEGAANRELQRLLAKIFKLPQNAVEILSGSNSKRKVVRLTGADKVALEQLILSK